LRSFLPCILIPGSLIAGIVAGLTFWMELEIVFVVLKGSASMPVVLFGVLVVVTAGVVRGVMGTGRKMMVLHGEAGVIGWSSPAIIPAVPLHLQGFPFI